MRSHFGLHRALRRFAGITTFNSRRVLPSPVPITLYIFVVRYPVDFQSPGY